MENPFDNVPNIDPLDETVDSFDAANMLGITVNNLRQMVFKKQLKVVGRKNRRTVFERSDVMRLKSLRDRDRAAVEGVVIAVSQADLPQDE